MRNKLERAKLALRQGRVRHAPNTQCVWVIGSDGDAYLVTVVLHPGTKDPMTAVCTCDNQRYKESGSLDGCYHIISAVKKIKGETMSDNLYLVNEHVAERVVRRVNRDWQSEVCTVDNVLAICKGETGVTSEAVESRILQELDEYGFSAA